MADHRHKRDANARRFNFRFPPARYAAGGVALVATLSTVGAGVLAASPERQEVVAASSSAAAAGSLSQGLDPVDLSERTPVVSRSDSRIDRVDPIDRLLTPAATAKAVRQADTRLWTTAPLNLWTRPDEDGRKVGLLEEGKKVLVTGREAADRVEVVLEGETRWVTSGYLVEDKPEPPAEAAESGTAELGGACTNGTSVEGQPNVIAVHEAVCAAFPELTSYGTYRSDGEHAQGIAIDIMVSGSLGWEVAEFVRAHYQELGVNYVIYSQKIWSVDRSSEGWRWMEDRGSVTANHYDHVHVTTY